VGVAVVVTLNRARNKCEEARLVYFSVGDGPVEAHHAEAVLQGQEPTPEAILEAAETAGKQDVDPNSDINASADYRRHLVKVLGQRALTEAVERARAGK
jgi:CO/xanthine dehydrogenase FAD-binding subunit